jgi:NAD(P)H-hydrate repair Nnr-like enzyme with NAD(P)H-hydrate dehydratase domain
LNEPENEIHRKQIIEITKTFHKIPGVLDAQAGEVVMSDRNIVDDSYDVGILIVTKNENELQNYLDHPIHQKAKKDVLVPLVDKILVYDFKN